MAEALFRQPFYATTQHIIRRAMDDVNRLDRHIFSDPSLGGHLQSIVEKYSLNVARLQTNGIAAEARQQERRARDAWGDTRNVTQGWLDVTIPFTGDAESLRISPSRSIILSHAVRIGEHHIILSIPDDDRADNEVQTLVNVANQNLDALRTEYQQFKPELEQAVQRAADHRKSQIASEGERDKRLSFPVHR